jgi:carbon-monoxide dehydrogenase small subunit
VAEHFITLTVNGAERSIYVDPTDRLIDVLRERLAFKSVKEGCSTGDCGICTVLANGRLVNSCLVLAAQCDGSRIITLEGALEDPAMKRLQDSFAASNAAQCGFCTPAMLMASWDLVRHTPDPTDEEIKTSISGVLCRCTGYYPILDSVRHACREVAER